MTQGNLFRGSCARAGLRVAALLLVASASGLWLTSQGARAAGGANVRAAFAQEDRLDIRLRSFSRGATGRLTIEASEGGGRGRITALNLPDPQAHSPGASTYVVWASSEGRVVRLGELRRDERGNGGLAFERPAGFERYSVIVTAEASADVERPGAPVLSTRANEAATLYPRLAREGEPAPTPQPTPVVVPPPPRPMPSTSRAPRRPGTDFYAEVDDALAANGGGRVIELEGERLASRASGAARVTQQTGSAYVRLNFRGVPLPSSVGAATYVLWAIVPDGRIVYMGSLPANEDLNRAEIYVRTGGFDADDYTLFVTAERGRPVNTPSEIRVLTPKNAKLIVK